MKLLVRDLLCRILAPPLRAVSLAAPRAVPSPVVSRLPHRKYHLWANASHLSGKTWKASQHQDQHHLQLISKLAHFLSSYCLMIIPINTQTNRLKCKNCPKSFKTTTNLNRHVREKHSNGAPTYQCTKGCGAKFTRNEYRKIHEVERCSSKLVLERY